LWERVRVRGRKMTRCAKIRKYLFEYCHNELSEEEANNVRRHLKECAKCSLVFQEAGQILAGLALNPLDLPPSGYWDEQREMLLEKAQAGRALLWLDYSVFRERVYAELTAAAAVIAGVLFLLPRLLGDFSWSLYLYLLRSAW